MRKANKIQLFFYYLLNLVAGLLTLNFVLFGFPFGLIFGLSAIMQVVTCFASLIVASLLFVELSEAKKSYIFN